jgi:hypothetical protein
MHTYGVADEPNTALDESLVRASRRASRLGAGLLSLDFRWPPPTLVPAYRSACHQLTTSLTANPTHSWTKVLHGYFKQHLRERLQSIGPRDTSALQVALREMSALGAMLMHLTVERSATGRARVLNERRTRTEYGTYPTSPRIAAAMARYLLLQLSRSKNTEREVRIVDPTMEGGPTLLELAFQLHRPLRRFVERSRFKPNIVLVGGDQNPSAAPMVSALLGAWGDTGILSAPQLLLRTADAFDTLCTSEPIFAITSNPPWGGSTDGATTESVDPFGPYVGYRDPYIALVSTGLRRLQGGGPFAYVLPFQVLTAPSAAGLRQELLANCVLDHVVLLPRSAFPRATIKSVMLLGRRHRSGMRRRGFEVVSYPITKRLSDPSRPSTITTSQRMLQRLRALPWLAILRSDPPLTPRARTCPLGSVAHVTIGIKPYQVGRGNPKQTRRTLRDRPFTFPVPTSGASPIARSRDVRRFRLERVSEYTYIGEWLAASGRHLEFARRERVFVREICGRDGSLVAAIPRRRVVARYGLFTIAPTGTSPEVVCALLNSSWAAGYVRSFCAGFHKESFGRVTASDLRNFPIPLALLDGTDTTESRHLRNKIQQLVKRLMTDATLTTDSPCFQELDTLLRGCILGDTDFRANGDPHSNRSRRESHERLEAQAPTPPPHLL